MHIPYRDLRVDDQSVRRKLLASVEKVLEHGRIILGPEVDEFEVEVAKRVQKKYAVGVNSGTDALYLSLRCLGVGPGDEVITTPLSWIATANSISLCGAKPVFVDIAEDLNINPDLLPAAITERTKVMLPVHFTGRMCKMPQIMEVCDKHGIKVVEDAAQAFGSHLNGEMAGSFGVVNCFSMNPMKVFCSYGEAGAVVTDDDELAHKLRSLRYAGTVNKEDCHVPSHNGRIDTIQAAMMLVNLQYLDPKIKRLREIADYYTDRLHEVVGCPLPDSSFHVYYSYTIIVEERDKLMAYLAARGVETKIQHPILMPRHTAYRNMFADLSYPVAERLVDSILCLPNHEKLTQSELDYIVETVLGFYGVA